MIHLLAQAPVDTATFDWKHAVIALLGLAATLVVQWWNSGGKKILEARLTAAGHPQASIAIDLLSTFCANNLTTIQKDQLAEKAAFLGVDHPAVANATGPKT